MLVEAGTPFCSLHAVIDAKERQARVSVSRKDKASRKWYNSAGWRGVNGRRARQLADEPLCKMCADDGRVRVANIADHVVPHRENYGLFWFGKLQSLCKTCHDIKKQREERRSDHRGGGQKSTDHPTGNRRV